MRLEEAATDANEAGGHWVETKKGQYRIMDFIGMIQGRPAATSDRWRWKRHFGSRAPGSVAGHLTLKGIRSPAEDAHFVVRRACKRSTDRPPCVHKTEQVIDTGIQNR